MNLSIHRFCYTEILIYWFIFQSDYLVGIPERISKRPMASSGCVSFYTKIIFSLIEKRYLKDSNFLLWLLILLQNIINCTKRCPHGLITALLSSFIGKYLQYTSSRTTLRGSWRYPIMKIPNFPSLNSTKKLPLTIVYMYWKINLELPFYFRLQWHS